MKRHFSLSVVKYSLLAFALLVFGCRREDIRDFTIKIPNMTESDKGKIVESLLPYGGVKKDSYKWDFAAKTLTLRYDSMQIAQSNIRMAIEGKGLKVEWPSPQQYAGHHKGE